MDILEVKNKLKDIEDKLLMIDIYLKDDVNIELEYGELVNLYRDLSIKDKLTVKDKLKIKQSSVKLAHLEQDWEVAMTLHSYIRKGEIKVD